MMAEVPCASCTRSWAQSAEATFMVSEVLFASANNETPLVCRSVERLIKLVEEFFPHRKQAFRRLDLIWDSS